MNKIFNKLLIGILFLLGVMLIPAFKADAEVTVTITANGVSGTKTVNNGEEVTIQWRSSEGTAYCYNNFGGTETTSGTYTFTASNTTSSPITTIFTVNCYAPSYCSGDGGFSCSSLSNYDACTSTSGCSTNSAYCDIYDPYYCYSSGNGYTCADYGGSCGCSFDSDCPTGFCDPYTNTCVECTGYPGCSNLDYSTCTDTTTTSGCVWVW